MRNRLRKLFNEGWTGKELSGFLKKYGIKRSWKTILSDIKNSQIIFVVKKIRGYIILPDDTVKKYLGFIIKVKEVKKTDGGMADLDDLLRDISAEKKERLDEEKREEESNKIFGEETIGQYDRCGHLDDRRINMGESIKTARRF